MTTETIIDYDESFAPAPENNNGFITHLGWCMAEARRIGGSARVVAKHQIWGGLKVKVVRDKAEILAGRREIREFKEANAIPFKS